MPSLQMGKAQAKAMPGLPDSDQGNGDASVRKHSQGQILANCCEGSGRGWTIDVPSHLRGVLFASHKTFAAVCAGTP